jgi:hypothetical protein
MNAELRLEHERADAREGLSPEGRTYWRIAEGRSTSVLPMDQYFPASMKKQKFAIL